MSQYWTQYLILKYGNNSLCVSFYHYRYAVGYIMNKNS